MVLVSVSLHALRYLHNLPVHTGIEITLPPQALEEFAVMSLTLSYERREDVNASVGIVGLNHVDDFLLRIPYHLLAGGIAVSRTRTCEKQSEIVINLRCGAHRGPWIAVGGLLFYADDGAESGYLVNVRALHVAEKVACIRRERLDVSALSFSVNGVERQ